MSAATVCDDAERPFDLTQALQEFGVGPSDNDDDGGDDEAGASAAPAADWASIGLRPSWQQLQITLRDAQLNVMAGLRRHSAGPPAAEARGGADAAGPVESRAVERQAESEAASQAVESEAASQAVESQAESATESEAASPAIESSDSEAVESADDVDALDADAFDADEEDDEDEDEDEDEFEEIGRLPTLHQLQFTLRNASEIIWHSGSLSSSDKPQTPEVRPADLLAKWAAPSTGMGWQSFMQHFTLPALPALPALPTFPALPSFLGEDSADEGEDCDETVLAALCDESALKPSDLEVEYNSEGLTGCDHYLRNCKVECGRCNRFYVCRLCHNEHEQHEMEARDTRRILCMNCHKPQPARRKCRFCKEVMGDYYCAQCRLWNDDPDRSIYHCDKCGICRVGRGIGIDVFHCDTCGICMSLTVENNHKCIERAANSGCPICLDDLFSSTNPVVFMPCGHPIHKDCFTEYSKRYYRCPVCAKSILNTSALFRMIDEEVQSEVLPPELANKKVSILCQDCRLKSHTSFHLAGLKCETCGSYNTAQL